jgi:hypothetical protein
LRKKPLLERVISRKLQREKTFIKRLQISIAVALIGHVKRPYRRFGSGPQGTSCWQS